MFICKDTTNRNRERQVLHLSPESEKEGFGIGSFYSSETGVFSSEARITYFTSSATPQTTNQSSVEIEYGDDDMVRSMPEEIDGYKDREVVGNFHEERLKVDQMILNTASMIPGSYKGGIDTNMHELNEDDDNSLANEISNLK